MDDPNTITVTFGEQNFMPHRYQGFRVGPFTVTVHVGANETPVEAYKRARDMMKPILDQAFLDARNIYAERFAIKT